MKMHSARARSHAIPLKKNTLARLGAFGVGLVASAGALLILLDHPIRTGDWQIKHVLVPLVLLIAIASGKLLYAAWRSGVASSAAGFGVAFVLATVWIVANSVGNQAELHDAKVAGREAQNATIARKEAELADARRELETATFNVAWEASGRPTSNGRRDGSPSLNGIPTGRKLCGGTCQYWQGRQREIGALIEKLERELGQLGTARPADPATAHWGAVAAFLGGDQATVERGIVLFMPIVTALIFELTSIWGFGFAFYAGPTCATARRGGHAAGDGGAGWPAQLAAAKLANEATVSGLVGITDAELAAAGDCFRPDDDGFRPEPPRPGARKPFPATVATHPVLRLVASNPGICNDDLAEAMGVTKGEASKRWREVAGNLETVRDGRFLRFYIAGNRREADVEIWSNGARAKQAEKSSSVATG